MNFALLNIQCLISKRTNKLKLKELLHIFENNDLILLTETWTNESSEISFPGFHVFYLSRTDRKQNSKRDLGGIAIYVRDKFYSSNMLSKTVMIFYGLNLMAVSLTYQTIYIYVYVI